MAVSMMALLRLSVYAFLLGAGLALFFLALRPLFSVLSSLPSAILGRRMPLRGQKGARGGRFLGFLADFFSALFVALVFILFLYWQADGIPRLFVFLFAGAGAYLAYRTLARPVLLAAGALAAFSYRFFFCLFSPLRAILSFFYRLLAKSLAGMIKRGKRCHTILKARCYMRTAPKRLSGRRNAAKLRHAVLTKGEVSHVG